MTGEPPTSSATGSIVGDAIAVFMLTMATAGISISMAVLIFSGDLTPGLPRAVGTFVLAAGIMGVWIAARSQFVPVATIVQDGPAIVFAAVAADLVAQQRSVQIADVFVLLFFTTLITGVVMWLLGRFQLGGLVRYIPTTVVGAFIAGTGWLLFRGGFEVMLDAKLSPTDVVDLFTTEQLQFWLPGFAVGVVGFLISRSQRLPAFAAGLLIMAFLATFYLTVLAVSSVEAAEQGGWLIGPFPQSAGLMVVSPAEIGNANWANIVGSLPGIASIIGLAIVALLLNLTGIGSQVARRVDADAELRTTAIANLVVSPLGVSPGFHAMGDTLMLKRLGATRRAVPMASGAILVLLGVVGVGAIGYVPRVIVGALLIMVGTGLLEAWVRGLLRSVSPVEQLLSIAILMVIAWLGILEGIGTGLVAACALFIVRYSRIDPVRTLTSGQALRSRVDRSVEQAELLDQVGDRLATFELQGYLFFGSLTSLEDRVLAVTFDEANELALDAVILDFKNVTGIDTSGYAVIGRLLGELHAAAVVTMTSSLDPKLQASLLAAVPDVGDATGFAPTLDDALEHCEELQLASQPAPATTSTGNRAHSELSSDLLAELDAISFAPGTVVMAQGSPSDGMMIVESGHLTAFLIDDDSRKRLRRFGKQTIVGEIGVITGSTRTAEIIAETHVTALWLSADRYRELRQDKPAVIFELHEFIMKIQAQRVVSLSVGLARSLR